MPTQAPRSSTSYIGRSEFSSRVSTRSASSFSEKKDKGSSRWLYRTPPTEAPSSSRLVGENRVSGQGHGAQADWLAFKAWFLRNVRASGSARLNLTSSSPLALEPITLMALHAFLPNRKLEYQRRWPPKLSASVGESLSYFKYCSRVFPSSSTRSGACFKDMNPSPNLSSSKIMPSPLEDKLNTAAFLPSVAKDIPRVSIRREAHSSVV